MDAPAVTLRLPPAAFALRVAGRAALVGGLLQLAALVASGATVAGSLLAVAVGVAASLIETARQGEMPLLMNLGVGPGALAAVAASPLVAMEAVLWTLGR